MIITLDQGKVELLEVGAGRPPSPTIVYEGFLIWAESVGLLHGMTRHLKHNPEGHARRLLLKDKRSTLYQRKWAARIARGQVFINGRIECVLNTAEQPQKLS